LFPESQSTADDNVEVFRRQQAAVGVILVEPVEWAMEDYVIASHARLTLLSDFLAHLLTAATKVFDVLWPETAVPTSMLQLA
jgi:hypothetical protein